jgi:hypothetical protein
MRNVKELSMTTDPASAACGANSLETEIQRWRATPTPRKLPALSSRRSRASAEWDVLSSRPRRSQQAHVRRIPAPLFQTEQDFAADGSCGSDNSDVFSVFHG